MKTLPKLSAAALVALGLVMPAAAQTNEPDCPEDFDTLPGCDMSPMDHPDFPANLEGLSVSGSSSTTAAGSQDDAGEPEAPETAEAETTETPAETASETETQSAEQSTNETAAAAAGEPAEHVVQAAGVKFVPAIIYVRPGDTVSWTNMASHNVETIDQMVPEGQEKINTELGASVTETFDEVGIVVYKCTPHWGNRMGGIIVVGEPENPGAIIDAYMESTTEYTQNLPARGLLKDLREDMEEKGIL